MKKLAAYLLILSTLLSFTVLAEDITNENVTLGRKYTEELNFLKSIGVSSLDILSKDTLTRGEFTSLVINTFYPENIFDLSVWSENVFTDVSSTHPYYAEIKAAKDLEIVNGTYNNDFLPDEIMNYQDAIVVIIKALGLKYYAVANGGYPTGYYAAAGSFEILKGISNSETVLTGDVASKLIYNALFSAYADVTSVNSEGELGLTVSPDKNLLLTKYNISKYDAKVIATPLSAIEGNVTEMGTVTLKLNDGSKLSVDAGNTNVLFDLGKMVTAYIKRNKETGKEEIVFCRDYKNMKTITVFGSDVLTVTSNYVEYEVSYDKFDKVKTEEFPDVIYNGVMQERYNYDSFKPQDGIITFIDGDGNGKSETISIMSFNYSGHKDSIAENSNPAWNIVVDRVKEEYISCIWNPRKNINLDSDEAVYVIKSLNEEIKALEDINSGDIISVATAPERIDGKTMYFLFVSRNTVNGMFGGNNVSENLITVNSVDYKVSSSIYSVRQLYYNGLNMESNITVCLDVCGKIAYIADMQNITNNYAYVISAKVNNIGGSRKLVVKLLEGTNSVNTYEVSEKAKIDGKSSENADEQYSLLSNRPVNYKKWINSETDAPYENEISRPVIVKFNNYGEISAINTDTPDYLTVAERVSEGIISKPGDERNIYSDANSIGYSNEEAYDSSKLKAGYRSPRTDIYRADSSTVQGRFYITSKTYVFRVPDIDTCGFNDYGIYLSNPSNNKSISYDIIKSFEMEKDDSNYKVVLSDTLLNEYKYDIQGYNIDPDTGIAEMVIIRGMDVNTVSDDGDKLELAVYLEKNTYYDPASEEEKTKIYYTVDGKTKLSAIYDKEGMHPAYDYIINGSSKTENFFESDIKALEKGDIIRVSLNGDRLSHIERAVIIKDLETSYSSLAKTRMPEGYFFTSGRVWYDVYNASGGTTGSYGRYIMVPDKIKGSFVHCIMGGKTDSKQGSSATYTLSDIDMDDPSTYVSVAADFGTVKPSLITLFRKADSTITDVKVSEGSLNDLRSLEEGYSVENASRIIYKHGDFVPTQIIIINYENVE